MGASKGDQRVVLSWEKPDASRAASTVLLQSDGRSNDDLTQQQLHKNHIGHIGAWSGPAGDAAMANSGYREGRAAAPNIECEGDRQGDFQDIVDSPYGAVHAEMISGDGEDEEFTITGDTSNAEDAAFDSQVGALQEAVLDDSFQDMLNAYCREHCHHFEDTEENKLIYTELFNQYAELIEGHLERQMASAIPGFSMASFLEELSRRGEDEIDAAVLDLLISLTDFMSFKQQMLMVKAGDAGLSLSGTASQIHVDEDEEGEARPDLDGLLTVSPASPSQRAPGIQCIIESNPNVNPAEDAYRTIPGRAVGQPNRVDPWDSPSIAGSTSSESLERSALPPLTIGGIQFSREDDIENMEKLSNLFGQVFYTHVLSPGDSAAAQAWQALSSDIWTLVQHAMQTPAMALSVAMCLYNYYWWEGPHNNQPNAVAGYHAAELMYLAVRHARCHEPHLSAQEFYILQCHLRWRYLLMLAGETGRYLAMQSRSIQHGSQMLSRARSWFREMRQLPNVELLHGLSTHEVNFNMDYYPAATMRFGPVWHDPLKVLPVASVLEASYPIIRSELESILRQGSTFENLDQHTRNAETQFGPRGDDWLTAYLFRKGEPIPEVCAHAPRTCQLLQQRPEIANCKMGGSGAGFLRMRPGGRLKPHFGNAPRLSVHLGLIVPDGEISMYVGYEELKWQEGKVIAFDDTFIHQVLHNGVEPRYVMNLWMCHPCDPYDGKLPGEQVPEYCHGGASRRSIAGLIADCTKDVNPERAVTRVLGSSELVMEDTPYDSLTREHLQKMAKWIVMLRGGDESSESTAAKAEDVLHEVIAKKFGEGFDPSRTTDGRSNEWQPGFVQIRHYRDAVYRLSKEPQGRQSAWIQQVLRDIAAHQEFHKELLEHEATSDSFAAFTAKMNVLLTNYLTAAKDEVQARESMESFCTHAAYKQHTYLYAQAILWQLRGKCPRQHQALLALSQALTSRGLQRFPSHVSRFDLSLSGDEDAKDLAGLLLSMSRRSGKELAAEAAKVCRILEGLFGFQDARTVLSPSLQEDRSPSTEVASDATEWGEQVCPDIPDPEGQPQVPVGQGSPAASSVRDNATAWNSSIQAPSWTARRESEGDWEEDRNSQRLDPTKGKKGVQWQMRSPQIFHKLLVQFVDPENEFHPADKRPCAKLLAIVCHDGLTSSDEAVRQSALEAVDEATSDLCAVYEVTHGEKAFAVQVNNLIRRIPQSSALGCAASLCWLRHHGIGGRLGGQERLRRMSQPVVAHLLQKACQAHDRQFTRILEITEYILEQLDSGSFDNEEVVSSGEEHKTPGHSGLAAQETREIEESRRKCFGYILELLVHFARESCCVALVASVLARRGSSWISGQIQSFLQGVFREQREYTPAFGVAVVRLLACDPVGTACTATDEQRKLAIEFLKKVGLLCKDDALWKAEFDKATEKVKPFLKKVNHAKDSPIQDGKNKASAGPSAGQKREGGALEEHQAKKVKPSPRSSSRQSPITIPSPGQSPVPSQPDSNQDDWEPQIQALQGQWLRDFDNMKVLVRGYKAIFGDGLQMQTMKLQARPGNKVKLAEKWAAVIDSPRPQRVIWTGESNGSTRKIVWHSVQGSTSKAPKRNPS
ncbi:arl2bp [Symbiodinium microadriaticum]|nr:arl2bp [Symbiodinium microadriaticum]